MKMFIFIPSICQRPYSSAAACIPSESQVVKTQPTWYNSLVNNCTTAIYELIDDIQPLPFDYRILLSGYIPSYLYDQQLIDNRYSLQQWQQRAHINLSQSRILSTTLLAQQITRS